MLSSTANIILPHGATYPLIYNYIHNLTSDKHNLGNSFKKKWLYDYTYRYAILFKAVTRVCMSLCTV